MTTGLPYGITLDTGALVALERREKRALTLLDAALDKDLPITLPLAALAEWHVGRRHGIATRLMSCFELAPLTPNVCAAVGGALRQLGLDSCHFVDACVVAVAACRPDRIDRVVTSDPHDIQRLAALFPGVYVVTL